MLIDRVVYVATTAGHVIAIEPVKEERLAKTLMTTSE